MHHILIIDDDQQFREMLEQLLKRESFLVSLAANGKEALNLFKKQQIDLVITDIIMPEKDGLEIISEFRRIIPDVKIIAISGGGQIKADRYLLLAKELGATKVISKPFERNELVATIKELLEGKKE